MTKSPQSKPNNLAESVFALGALIAILGGFNFAFAHFSSGETDVPLPVSSNTQRNLAIQNALMTGQKTYQFESNFIPGIGNITDPDAYTRRDLPSKSLTSDYKKQFENSVDANSKDSIE